MTSCAALNTARHIKQQLDFNDWAEEIKKLAKKDEDYNWKNGNGFFERRKIKKGGVRTDDGVVHQTWARLDKKIAKENLLIFKKIADKNGLKFWLVDGTLLGAIREKDFIRYDTDTDIQIDFKDIPILINCIPELMEHSLNPLRVAQTEISFAKDYEYIDVELLRAPTKHTKQLDKIIFLNEEFNIPTYVDEYLTILYGDWRTPSRKHSPSLRKQARLFSK